MSEPPDETDNPSSRLPRLGTGTPDFETTTATLGVLRFYEPRYIDIKNLAKVHSDQITPEAFATELIRVLGRRQGQAEVSEGDVELTAEDVGSLTPNERKDIVAGLLSAFDFLYSQPVKKAETAEDGSRTEGVEGSELVLPREEGETDEAYLLRSWRDYMRRFGAGMAESTKHFQAYFGGLSEALKSSIMPNFLASAAASNRLSDQIAKIGISARVTDQFGVAKFAKPVVPSLDVSGITRAAEGVKLVASEPDRSPFINIPRNPAYDTNEILGAMGVHIEKMAGIAASSAEIQQNLDEAAWILLGKFTEGATQSKDAGDRALSVAKITMWISVFAIVVTLVGAGLQYFHDRQRDAAADAQHAADIATLGAQTDAANRLTTAIVADSKARAASAADGAVSAGAGHGAGTAHSSSNGGH